MNKKQFIKRIQFLILIKYSKKNHNFLIEET